MTDQRVFNLGTTFKWGDSPQIHPDDPRPLKVAKKLMHQERTVYVKQPDGTYACYKAGADYAETDSDTVVFTDPSEGAQAADVEIKDGE